MRIFIFKNDPSTLIRHVGGTFSHEREKEISPLPPGEATAQRWVRVWFCVFVLFSLSACKIELNIFSSDDEDKVVSESGNFNCTNDPNSSDCVQQYVANISDCEGYTTGDTWEDLPNCTELPTAGVEELLVAVPNEGNEFDGWGDFCIPGASVCTMGIQGDADVESEAIVEAHFGSSAQLQDATYTYNHKGQRASKTVGTVTTFFIYDLQGNLIGEYDSSGNPLREYVYIEGKLLAQYDYVPSATEPEQHYYFNDHLGTPVYMINREPSPSYELATGPFGEGYGEFKLAGMVQPVRFPGQYADSESGYSYNWNRDYDPSTGRYLQSDPIGLRGGINTYLYANANPVMFLDFNGLDPGQIFSSKGSAAADLGDYSMRMHGMGYSNGVYEVGECQFTYDWVGGGPNSEPPPWTYEPIHPGPDPVPSDPTPKPPAPPPPGKPESGPNWQLYIDIATIVFPQSRFIKAASAGSDAWSVVMEDDIEGPALSLATGGLVKKSGASGENATRASAAAGAAHDATSED